MTDPTILAATAYADECQMLSWSESDKGMRVTFMLSPLAAHTHPFKQFKHGTRFMMAATLIGSDETPEPVREPAVPAQQPTKRHFKDLPRSQQAAIKCQDKDFQEWLGFTQLSAKLQFPDQDLQKVCADHANGWLKMELQIQSKRDLDTDPEAASRFDSLLTDYDTRAYTR